MVSDPALAGESNQGRGFAQGDFAISESLPDKYTRRRAEFQIEDFEGFSIILAAVLKTFSSIFAVSFPVNVFCWLG